MNEQHPSGGDAPTKPAPAAQPPLVHALLVCRSVQVEATGEITIKNVVEVLPVEKVPSEVGPLVFLVLVRNLPAGPGQAAFLLRPPGEAEKRGRLPLETRVPSGLAGRQVALQVTVPKLPVPCGGWFELHFEWRGQVLASTRFAVGVRG